jgi:hypothetical protein
VRAAVEGAFEVLRELAAEIRDVRLGGVDALLPGLVGIAIAEGKDVFAEALRDPPRRRALRRSAHSL